MTSLMTTSTSVQQAQSSAVSSHMSYLSTLDAMSSAYNTYPSSYQTFSQQPSFSNQLSFQHQQHMNMTSGGTGHAPFINDYVSMQCNMQERMMLMHPHQQLLQQPISEEAYMPFSLEETLRNLPIDSVSLPPAIPNQTGEKFSLITYK